MDNGREILKQIFFIICIITLPSLAAWIFGAWGAITVIVAFMIGLVYYTAKYRG